MTTESSSLGLVTPLSGLWEGEGEEVGEGMGGKKRKGEEWGGRASEISKEGG